MSSPKKIEGWNVCFAGFSFFLNKPKFWFLPLSVMLFAWTFLFALFVFVTYMVWPEQVDSHLKYSLKIFQAMGISAVLSLSVWFLFFSFFLNSCFENLIKKTLLSKGDKVKSPSFFNVISSSFYMFYKTLFWRLLWIVIAILSAIFLGPLTLLISQFGVCHIALIDGCDLSLGLKGISSKQRLLLIRSHNKAALFGGIVSGIISTVFIPTVLIWLFWIPSLYIGACLWTRQWPVEL